MQSIEDIPFNAHKNYMIEFSGNYAKDVCS